MADVPDQAVGRRVEDVMESDGKLDDAKPRAEMPAGDGDGRNRLLAQFVGKLAKLAAVEAAKLLWSLHDVEQWSDGAIGHSGVLYGTPT
jgi:hypothetical protein